MDHFLLDPPHRSLPTLEGLAMLTRVFGALSRPLGALLVLGGLLGSAPQPAAADPLMHGDVIVGLGSSADGTLEGEVRNFSASGDLRQSLFTNSGSFEENGMCMDTARNLYTTNFDANSMSKFDANGNLLHSHFGTGFNEHPNSCVFDASGVIYVGQSDKNGEFGGGGLLKLDQAGNVLATFSPLPEQRGTDWIDLAADQCTLFYTSVGSTI